MYVIIIIYVASRRKILFDSPRLETFERRDLSEKCYIFLNFKFDRVIEGVRALWKSEVFSYCMSRTPGFDLNVWWDDFYALDWRPSRTRLPRSKYILYIKIHEFRILNKRSFWFHFFFQRLHSIIQHFPFNLFKTFKKHRTRLTFKTHPIPRTFRSDHQSARLVLGKRRYINFPKTKGLSSVKYKAVVQHTCTHIPKTGSMKALISEKEPKVRFRVGTTRDYKTQISGVPMG